MLKTLVIKNYAIIENTILNFNHGFNVIIGETGAGKSIILKALNFVLGGKPSKDSIRNDCEQTTVKAIFESPSKAVREKLNDFQIEVENELILSRSFNIEGKSFCSINGEVVTVLMLKQIGDMLASFFGQNESIEILNNKYHLKLLDEYKSETLKETKNQLKAYLTEYNDLSKQIEKIGGYGEDRERTLDLLSYQINEIESANIEDNEDELLDEKIKVLSNFEKLYGLLQQSHDILNNTELNCVVSNLHNASLIDGKFNDLANRINCCSIEIDDINASLKEYMSNMTFSENEIDILNERKEQLKTLKKKYGNTLIDVKNYLQKIKFEYDDVLNSQDILNNLVLKQNNLKHLMYLSCKELHDNRVKIAEEIEIKVKKELSFLGMKNTDFSIQFKTLPKEEESNFSYEGLDSIEFLFSANAGEKQKSLSKVISGGEMSRFMLAIKNVFAESNEVKLLIFDEVDNGVSGEIGYKVGQKIAKLAKKYQIICITHLAQVTALADNFIYIQKIINEGKTNSVAQYLNDEQILEYLASLFATKSSQIGLLHAKELVTMANDYKQSLNN